MFLDPLFPAACSAAGCSAAACSAAACSATVTVANFACSKSDHHLIACGGAASARAWSGACLASPWWGASEKRVEARAREAASMAAWRMAARRGLVLPPLVSSLSSWLSPALSFSVAVSSLATPTLSPLFSPSRQQPTTKTGDIVPSTLHRRFKQMDHEALFSLLRGGCVRVRRCRQGDRKGGCRVLCHLRRQIGRAHV